MIQFVPRRNMLCQGYKYNKSVNYLPKELITAYYEYDITHIYAFCGQKLTFLTSQLAVHNVTTRLRLAV